MVGEAVLRSGSADILFQYRRVRTGDGPERERQRYAHARLCVFDIDRTAKIVAKLPLRGCTRINSLWHQGSNNEPS